MFGRRQHGGSEPRGFLMRLLRDARGNALVIMTVALIPLAGMVGGGIDVSRMYILKTRLQHACDAGALAGRKAMGGGTWAYNSNYAQTQANLFFDGNFQSGSFSSTGLTRNFTENAGKVTGSASATIPMTLMKIFGKTTETLAVTCDAEMRLPNTDVMFVLDTTGSMGDIPSGDTATKMASLKVAVKCFYEIVARLDTDATCTTGTPSGGTGNQVQIRFGFVPYATNVNVGKLLKPEWFADSANYQTREARFVNNTSTNTAVTDMVLVNRDERSWSNTATVWYNQTSTQCDAQPVPPTSGFTAINPEGNPTEATPPTGSNPVYRTWATYQYGQITEYRRNYNATNDRCRIQQRTVYGDLRRTYTRTDTTTRSFDGWRYASLPVDVSLLKNGTGWNSSFQWPVGSQGANTTINWDGCVEERQTVSQSSYSPIPSGAQDLDLDTAPVAGDAATQWRPVLPDLIYTRFIWNGWRWDRTTNELTTDSPRDVYYACPREARKLQQWTNASAFSSYVDSLSPEGNTYHDIGLIWGGRLLSPTGLFASENAYTPQGGEIERHMIFMTDGDPCTGINNYTAYGVNWWDRRTVSGTPTEGCTTNGTLTQQVNARTEALCTAIKNKNITLWVITFGYVDPNTVTRMTNCASSGRYFSANNAAQLQSTFKTIADQISMLRLTK